MMLRLSGIRPTLIMSVIRLIPLQDLFRPANEIFRTLPGGLVCHPELQVLDSIVILDAVDVVNVLTSEKGASQVLLHSQPVLQLLLLPPVDTAGPAQIAATVVPLPPLASILAAEGCVHVCPLVKPNPVSLAVP